jgi:hypothetical protein
MPAIDVQDKPEAAPLPLAKKSLVGVANGD